MLNKMNVYKLYCGCKSVENDERPELHSRTNDDIIEKVMRIGQSPIRIREVVDGDDISFGSFQAIYQIFGA